MVVMGATMLVSKFIEKRKEAKRAESFAENEDLRREIAMINPQVMRKV